MKKKEKKRKTQHISFTNSFNSACFAEIFFSETTNSFLSYTRMSVSSDATRGPIYLERRRGKAQASWMYKA